MLADRQCDAIILYTRHMSEKAIMSLINSIAMPLVVINRDVARPANAACSSNSRKPPFRPWSI
jgi:DNA-binding LacI/PurR family transcriptional regulator